MTGILGSANLYNSIPQSIYICDKDGGAVVTLNVCNRTTLPAFISVAISDVENVPTNDEWIEYEVEIKPKGVLERSGIVLAQGQYLTIKSSIDSISAVCWGVTSGDSVEVDPITINSGTGPVWISTSSIPYVYGGYSTSISLINTGPAATYTVSSGSLPTGMSLNANTAVLSGTPSGTYAVNGSPSNSFTFDITATNQVSGTSVKTFNIIRKWYDGSSAENAAPNPATIRTTTGITTDGDYWYKPTGYAGAAIQLYTNFTYAPSGKGYALIARGREAASWWMEEGQNTSALNSANLTVNTPVAVAPAAFINGLITSRWDQMKMLINRRNSNDSWLHTGKSVNSFAWVYFTQSPSQTTSSLVRYNGLWMQSGVSTTFNDSQLWSDSLNIGGSNDCTRLFTWTWSGHSNANGQWQGWSGGASCTPAGSFQVAAEGHALQLVNCYIEC